MATSVSHAGGWRGMLVPVSDGCCMEELGTVLPAALAGALPLLDGMCSLQYLMRFAELLGAVLGFSVVFGG